MNECVTDCIDVPHEYRKSCVPRKSAFGFFIKRYNLHHAAKKSKVQKLVDEKSVSFTQMTKFDFLKYYMLNENYTLADFLNLKDASFRGFIYETLWDICFKCNVVDGFDESLCEHLEGKIEDSKNKKQKKKEFSEEFEGKFKELKVITNMYEYLSANIVQSGNTGGISDITLRYKKDAYQNTKICKKLPAYHNGHYVFISSKCYLDEQSIDKYDIAEIKHAANGLGISFKIVLVVKDYQSLKVKLEHTHKRSTRESIYRILDVRDLEISFNRLRAMFSALCQNQGNTNISNVYKTFVTSMGGKAVPHFSFETYVMYNTAQSTLQEHNIATLHVQYQKYLIHLILLYAFNYPNKHIMVKWQNEEMKTHIFRKMQKYFGFNPSALFFDSRAGISTKSVNHSDIIIAIETTIDSKTYTKWTKYATPNTKIILVGTEKVYDNTTCDFAWTLNIASLWRYHVLDKNMDKVVTYMAHRWNVMEDAIFMTFGSHYINTMDKATNVPDRVIECLGNYYKTYPEVNLFTNLPHRFLSKTFQEYADFFQTNDTEESVIDNLLKQENNVVRFGDLLFGKEQYQHEDYIGRQRLHNFVDSLGTTMVIVKDNDIRKIVERTWQNAYQCLVSPISSLGNYTESVCLQTVLIATAEIPPETLYALLSNMYFNRKFSHINICSFDISTTKALFRMFDKEVQETCINVDRDIHNTRRKIHLLP
jgi:hypothetical protein